MQQLEHFLASVLKCTQNDIRALLACFATECMEKGSYFAIEGEYSSKFAFLLSGTMRAFFRSNEGVEYNKTFFGENNFVGAYSSLVSKQENRINIQCLTKCELVVAPYESLVKLYDEHPMVERLARIISEQFFVSKEKREIELVMLDASERYEIFKKEHPALENLIPQYHIASYLGITPTQLSRIRAAR